jgi:large subunit ribosomal protein L31e
MDIFKMVEDKIYTIPLRKEWLKVPVYKRSKKAVTAAKQFLSKHLKKEVKIGPHLNEHIWDKGNRHPPGKVKVRIEEEGENTFAELINAPKREVKKENKDTVTIKRPKILGGKGKEQPPLEKNVDEEKKKKAKEKEEIDKKAIEKVPEDKQVEKTEKEEIKVDKTKIESPKKEKIIATEKGGRQLRE